MTESNRYSFDIVLSCPIVFYPDPDWSLPTALEPPMYARVHLNLGVINDRQTNQ